MTVSEFCVFIVSRLSGGTLNEMFPNRLLSLFKSVHRIYVTSSSLRGYQKVDTTPVLAEFRVSAFIIRLWCSFMRVERNQK